MSAILPVVTAWLSILLVSTARSIISIVSTAGFFSLDESIDWSAILSPSSRIWFPVGLLPSARLLIVSLTSSATNKVCLFTLFKSSALIEDPAWNEWVGVLASVSL